MFVHSGASLHGHEFSSRSSRAAGNQMHTTHRFRSALAHSPSPSPSPSERTATTMTTPATTPTRRFSLQSNESPTRRPDALRRRPVSDIAPRKEQVVRFNEQPSILPLEDLTSEDDTFSDTFSDIASVDGAGQRRRRSKRTPKPATNFLLAYPPPRLRTKQRRFVQIRPRLLLQLQQLSADKRPKPMLDILPARVLTGTHIVPRLARRCPEMFKLRGHLGLDDLMVAKSEDFDSPDDNINVKNLDKRDLVAVISPVAARRENDRELPEGAEIVLTDGSVWTASSYANGFEFHHVDSHGITKKARWVKKSSKRDRYSTGPMNDLPSSSASAHDYKFTFSMIDPSSRRHPVMATLTPTNLEILDHYTTPSPASNSRRAAAVRPFSPNMAEDAIPFEKTVHPVDEETRTLIAITSIWVSFRHGQGWATEPRPAAPSLNTRVSCGSMERARANTYPISPSDSNSTSPMTPFPSSNGSSVSVVPRRALSTGAAYMQRRQARLGHDSPPMVVSLAESDEGTDDSKPPSAADVQAKKPGIYRRLRNWGHRFSTGGKKRGEE